MDKQSYFIDGPKGYKPHCYIDIYTDNQAMIDAIENQEGVVHVEHFTVSRMRRAAISPLFDENEVCMALRGTFDMLALGSVWTDAINDIDDD